MSVLITHIYNWPPARFTPKQKMCNTHTWLSADSEKKGDVVPFVHVVHR